MVLLHRYLEHFLKGKPYWQNPWLSSHQKNIPPLNHCINPWNRTETPLTIYIYIHIYIYIYVHIMYTYNCHETIVNHILHPFLIPWIHHATTGPELCELDDDAVASGSPQHPSGRWRRRKTGEERECQSSSCLKIYRHRIYIFVLYIYIHMYICIYTMQLMQFNLYIYMYNIQITCNTYVYVYLCMYICIHNYTYKQTSPKFPIRTAMTCIFNFDQNSSGLSLESKPHTSTVKRLQPPCYAWHSQSLTCLYTVWSVWTHTHMYVYIYICNYIYRIMYVYIYIYMHL